MALVVEREESLVAQVEVHPVEGNRKVTGEEEAVREACMQMKLQEETHLLLRRREARKILEIAISRRCVARCSSGSARECTGSTERQPSPAPRSD